MTAEDCAIEARRTAYETAFGANAVRLGPREWIVAGVLFFAVYAGLPRFWPVIEPLETDSDYRIPASLSGDYWFFARYAREATADPQRIAIIGDSVVWGEYVRPAGTLSHALNAELGQDRFVNLGVSGGHPIALNGLVKHYGAGVSGRKVVLHYNPLWMTSKRRDLQSNKPQRFNHPRLVPQFYPRIPSYDASIAERLSAAVSHEIPFLSWTNHIRIAYFQSKSLPSWTMENPYTNPLSAITLDLPAPENRAASDSVPWTQKEVRRQAFEWVTPRDSLQWAFFQQSLATLQARRNDVLVLWGPFNEAMMTDEDQARFRTLKAEMMSWLESCGVAVLAPPSLPSEMYADASHPLEEGYSMLARTMLASDAVRAFLKPAPD